MANNIWSQHSSKLSGGWRTISFEVFDPANRSETPVAKPHGDEPLGRVLISPSGFLSAHMARPDRMKQPLPSARAWQQGEDAEVAHVARGLSMYCGYLQLFEDADGLFWQTKVEVSSDPSRMGGIEERRVRYWQEGERCFMELRPKNDMVMEVCTMCRRFCLWNLTICAGRTTCQRCFDMGEV